MLTELILPRGIISRPSVSGYIVPGASHQKITPLARPGRVPIAEY